MQKNLKIFFFKECLFSLMIKLSFASFFFCFLHLFGRWEAWQCSREWRFPWQKVARKSSWRKGCVGGWRCSHSRYSGTRMWGQSQPAQRVAQPEMGVGVSVHVS